MTSWDFSCLKANEYQLPGPKSHQAEPATILNRKGFPNQDSFRFAQLSE
jgi:hypothetical protein